MKSSTQPVSEEASVYGEKAEGLSITIKYLRAIKKSVTVHKRPLSYLEPRENSILIINAPDKKISELEVEKILDFVKQGGTLYLTFPRPENEIYASPILKEIPEYTGTRPWVFYKEKAAIPFCLFVRIVTI